MAQFGINEDTKKIKSGYTINRRVTNSIELHSRYSEYIAPALSTLNKCANLRI